MVIIGAGGHAVEVLDILSRGLSLDDIFFFDNVSADKSIFNGLYPIISSWDALQNHFLSDPDFVLAVGASAARKQLALRCRGIGGSMKSVIAPTALIGDFNVVLGAGLNIMHQAVITGDVQIGEGSLINAMVTVHHSTRIGDYCEISPGARLLGGAIIGNECSIGASAVILPNVRIGNGAVVGAGAVVTRDVESGSTVIGIPAKPIHE